MNYSNIRKSIFAILLLHCMPSVLAMQQIAVAQKNGTVFINKAPDLGYMRDYSKKAGRFNEITIYNEKRNAIKPGIYYHTTEGIKPVPTSLKSSSGQKMLKNQLLGLSFSQHVNSKKHNKGDTFHNFPDAIEKEFGEWARVVIDNRVGESLVDSNKKFYLYITIPGKISEIDYSSGKAIEQKSDTGVFEFVVRKSPYVRKGFCVHRFFSPKGVIGAEEFGAEARAAGQEELTKFDIRN